MPDQLLRFLLRDADVRGQIVSLDASWQEVSNRHPGHEAITACLGELTAAGLLLAASLKFDGKLILQVHGDGPVALLVVECDAQGSFRSTVKLREDVAITPDMTLNELVNANGRGRFVVTLDPEQTAVNRQPYQGIVSFEGNSVAQVLEHYMVRSEQVPTRLWLATDRTRAVGLMLQRLPQEGGASLAQPETDAWNRMTVLADTLTTEELLALPSEQTLHRLFWQEPLLEAGQRECRFACSCSREKVADMLRMLGREEVDSILTERGTIDVRCEFCNQPYVFDAVDSAGLFVPTAPTASSSTQH